jgi:hypothetical protein
MSGPSTPTVVLVHGAFADASGFGGVIRELTTSGYDVVAPPNPLRSLAPDAERFMAERMGATTQTIDGSHTAFIAQPVTVANFIKQALPAAG